MPTATPLVGEAPAATAEPTQQPFFWVEAPIPGDPSPILARVPPAGAVLEGDIARLHAPPIASTPRRVGIQAGHWRSAEAPSEFPNLPFQVGSTFDGVAEVDVTLDVARRVAAVLLERGIAVDLLPATIPPGYLADAFVSLHADADLTRMATGFKIAHGFYRSPYDEQLVAQLTEHYAAGTGLPQDPNVTGDMIDYYPFAWWKYEHALSPHTAAAIVEMGFVSHPDDRALLLGEQEVVARALAEGIIRFLDAVPRAELFGGEILVPTVPPP